MDGLKERLRALRESRGYSQKGLAKRLGCSPSLISSYETGERSPSLQNLGELADCFGVTADYLLGRTPPEPGLDLTGLTEEQRAAVEVVVRGMRRQNDTDFPGNKNPSLSRADREGEKSCGAGVSAYWADPCAGTAR